MATEIEAGRQLVYKAAWLKDQGRPFATEAAMAKLYTGELSNRVVNDALQIHGGYGYMDEFPISRLYRDQKILEIGEGTNEVQRMVIAKALGLVALGAPAWPPTPPGRGRRSGPGLVLGDAVALVPHPELLHDPPGGAVSWVVAADDPCRPTRSKASSRTATAPSVASPRPQASGRSHQPISTSSGEDQRVAGDVAQSQETEPGTGFAVEAERQPNPCSSQWRRFPSNTSSARSLLQISPSPMCRTTWGSLRGVPCPPDGSLPRARGRGARDERAQLEAMSRVAPFAHLLEELLAVLVVPRRQRQLDLGHGEWDLHSLAMVLHGVNVHVLLRKPRQEGRQRARAVPDLGSDDEEAAPSREAVAGDLHQEARVDVPAREECAGGVLALHLPPEERRYGRRAAALDHELHPLEQEDDRLCDLVVGDGRRRRRGARRGSRSSARRAA